MKTVLNMRSWYQARVWYHSHVAKPKLGYVLKYGYTEDARKGIAPIFFTGKTITKVLDNMICNCNGARKCSRACSCAQQGMACCEMCSREGAEECHNDLTHGNLSESEEEGEEGDDEEWEEEESEEEEDEG